MTRLELERIAWQDVSLPDGWRVRIMEKGDGFLVQIVFVAKDSATGEEAEQRCRKWYVSSHVTITEVVRTLYKAGIAALEHEFSEAFKYQGAAVFHPHRSVGELAANCDFDRRG